MEKDFEINFKKTMHDASSYELVSFETLNAYRFNEDNQKILDSLSLNKSDKYVDTYFILSKEEEKEDKFFTYKRALISVRGVNSLGNIILSRHTASYDSKNKLKYIDGEYIHN